jgi:hypothetical protein
MDVAEVEPLAPSLDVRGVIRIASAKRTGVSSRLMRSHVSSWRWHAPHDREHVADAAEPVVQRRGRQIDVLAPKLLGEPLDGIAVEHLGDRELGEQARRRHAAGNQLGMR